MRCAGCAPYVFSVRAKYCERQLLRLDVVVLHQERRREAAQHREGELRGARHPRGNAAWPRVGILAQRGKDRPNRIGSTVVRILGREGRVLRVAGLDAVDGSPVLDVKPVFREFLPRGELRQPPWVRELTRDYWRRDGGS